MRYEVGSKVRIAKKVDNFNSAGLMDKYLGKTVTISKYDVNDNYRILEDDGRWFWDGTCFEPVEQDITLVDFFRRREAVLNNYGRTGGKCNNVKCGSCPFGTGNGCEMNMAGITTETIDKYVSLLIKAELEVANKKEAESRNAEIEELEKQAREIADRLAKLKEK